MSAVLIFGYVVDGGAAAQLPPKSIGAATVQGGIVAAPVAVAPAATAVPSDPTIVAAQTQLATAEPAAVQPMDSGAGNSGDFATDAFGDAWDFNNAADLTPMMNGLSVGLSGLHLQALSPTNSALVGTVAHGSYLMLSGTGPHVLPWGRDPRVYPIDANRYTQLTLSMYSSVKMGAGAFYQLCIDGPATCYNGSPFGISVGWHVYTLNLAKAGTYFPDHSKWSGHAGMLRLGLNPPTSAAIQIDWIRLGTTDSSTLNPAQPEPTIISPSHLDGDDYATTVRGRPWYFQSPGDLALTGIGNVSYSAAGMRGQNVITPTIPRGNDPHIGLPIPVPINGSTYNQMAISVCYDGKFALSDNPGGGMNGRVIWKIAGETFERNSQDFLVFPGCQVIDLDLSGPATVVEDDTDARFPGGQRGFAGQSIVSLRFDPDEDPGRRYFSVSSIRLTKAVTAPRGYAIAFADKNWQGSTTADVWLDADGSGTRLIPIFTGKAVSNGVNTFAWLGRDTASNVVAPGSYFVKIRLTNKSGDTAGYSTTRILVGPKPATPGPVVGVQATAGKGTVNVSWSPPTSGGVPLGYLVRASNGQGRLVAWPGRSATFPGLQNGTAYGFMVTAVNGSGSSAASADVRATPAAAAGTYVSLTSPVRLVDTRRTAAVQGGSALEVQVAGGAYGLPSAGVSAVAVNVTSTGSTSGGYLTVWPSGQTRPTTSSLNFEQGVDTANMVVAKLGDNGRISIFNSSGATHVLVDVVGYYSDGQTTGATYFPLSPHRVLDTRSGVGGTRTAVAAHGTIALKVTGVGGVPSGGVSSVVLNVAGVAPTAGTYLTVWPAGQGRPTASALNLRRGDNRANLVTVRVGSGGLINLYNASGAVDVIADVVGWFGAPGDLTGASLLPLSPYRIFDSRPASATSLSAAAVSVGAARTVNLTEQGSGVPIGTAKAVLANVTTVAANTNGYFTMWPTGEAQPAASTINLRAGEVRPNLVSERLKGSGNAQFAVNAGATDVVVDLVAWYG